MSDIRVFTFILIFSVSFLSITSLMIGDSPEGIEVGDTAPTGVFSLLLSIISFSTGITFIDGVIMPIFYIMTLFLIYRAIRGQ